MGALTVLETERRMYHLVVEDKADTKTRRGESERLLRLEGENRLNHFRPIRFGSTQTDWSATSKCGCVRTRVME
jgi:hypothetical protein